MLDLEHSMNEGGRKKRNKNRRSPGGFTFWLGQQKCKHVKSRVRGGQQQRGRPALLGLMQGDAGLESLVGLLGRKAQLGLERVVLPRKEGGDGCKCLFYMTILIQLALLASSFQILTQSYFSLCFTPV